MKGSNAALFRRYTREADQMLRATMPNTTDDTRDETPTTSAWFPRALADDLKLQRLTATIADLSK